MKLYSLFKNSSWQLYCQQFAVNITPAEEDFSPQVFLNSKQQRENYIKDMVDLLQNHLTEKMASGIEAFLLALAQRPKKVQEKVWKLLYVFKKALDKNLFDNTDRDAEIEMATILGLDQSSLQVIEQIGCELLCERQWSQADVVFMLLLVWQHNNPLHWFHRALALYFIQESLLAIDCLKKAINKAPQQPEFYLLQSSCYLARGQNTEAKRCLEYIEIFRKENQVHLSSQWANWEKKLLSEFCKIKSIS